MSTRESFVIRMPSFIRFLGLFTALVAAFPSLAGCIYFAFNLGELAQNPWSLAFVLPLAIIPTWLGWRFFSMKGVADSSSIELRGMWRSVRIPTAHLRSLEAFSWPTEKGVTRVSYILRGHDGESLGTIPPMLTGLRHFNDFVVHLRRLARLSRDDYGQNTRPLQPTEKPTDEWTLEDFERYENQVDSND